MAKRKPEHDARLGEPEPTFWSNPFSFTFFWWFGRVLLRVRAFTSLAWLPTVKAQWCPSLRHRFVMEGQRKQLCFTA